MALELLAATWEKIKLDHLCGNKCQKKILILKTMNVLEKYIDDLFFIILAQKRSFKKKKRRKEKVILGTTPNLKSITENTHKFDYVHILNFIEKNIPQAMSKDKQQT